jgi:hypothetical protein
MKTINKLPMSAMILRHLEDKGSITNVEAQALYRCRSLSRRVCDIKAWGFPIKSHMKKDATGQRYVRYTLEG